MQQSDNHRYRQSYLCSWFALGAILFLCAPLVTAQIRPADQKLLDDTKSAYSTLRRQGLREVRASMTPNWEKTLRGVPPGQKATVIKLANRLRFSVLADSRGQISVTHRLVGPKPEKTVADALDNFAKGVELSATGFLMSWSPFMLTSLIPEKVDKFVLQNFDSQYVLSFVQDGVDVTVSMTKELLMTELRTPQGTLKPLLKRTARGFILTGYEAVNENPVVGHIELKARVESQIIQGLALPKVVYIEGNTNQIPFDFELHFTNYRIKTAARGK